MQPDCFVGLTDKDIWRSTTFSQGSVTPSHCSPSPTNEPRSMKPKNAQLTSRLRFGGMPSSDLAARIATHTYVFVLAHYRCSRAK
jgi:hypothetical protein